MRSCCCGWPGWSVQKSEPISRLNIRRPNMVKQGLMYWKQNWKWMLERSWKNENIGSYVGHCEEPNRVLRSRSAAPQPPCHPSMLSAKLLLFNIYTCKHWECRKVWVPKLVIKMEGKTKQKQGGSGVGDVINMAWNVGSVKTRKRCCGDVKNFQGCFSV